MKNKMNELNKVRDDAFIRQFCQDGAYMGDHGQKIIGVCRTLTADEVLTFMHQHDAILAQELLKDETES